MARKSKLTPQLQEKIVSLISAGNYIRTACVAVGIDEDTYFRWLKRAKKGEKPYTDFAEAIKKAEAAAEVLYLNRIRKAADDGTWVAAAWFLERKYPTRWGRKDELAVGGQEGKPIKVKLVWGEETPIAEKR